MGYNFTKDILPLFTAKDHFIKHMGDPAEGFVGEANKIDLTNCAEVLAKSAFILARLELPDGDPGAMPPGAGNRWPQADIDKFAQWMADAQEKVQLETPILRFDGVPEGDLAFRAVVFSLTGCAAVTLEIVSGPDVLPGSAPGTSFGTLLGTVVTADPATDHKGYVWITYTGTNDGDIASGAVTIRCVETNTNYDIAIEASTIARPAVAVVLTLDQSGSMGALAGSTGATRMKLLKPAATLFVQLIQANNGVGIIRFDHDAYPTNDPTYPGFPVTRILTDEMFDQDRVNAQNAVASHNTNPAGFTSIGDGVALARSTLNAIPPADYNHKAIIVFTDGLENRDQYIADVMGSIDNRTYAIGLGSETQVSTAALTALTAATGGYLLLTGHLTDSIDDYFRLSKYFLQILAGVTNNIIVTDPTGFVAPGTKLRIPFILNETDIQSTAILLTDLPAVRFAVETPDGDIMDPGVAAGLGATYAVGTNVSHYRFTLPVPLGAGGAHEGTWHALLEVNRDILRKHLSALDNNPAAFVRASAHGVRYSLNVHAYSNLRMDARLVQNSLEPGATLTLRAVLTEYGLPVAGRATVEAELQRPDNTTVTLALAEAEPGVFEVSTPATVSGVYRFRMVASGVTMRGLAFTREQLLTGAVFQGGDAPLPTSQTDLRLRDEQRCHLLECLFDKEMLGRFLAEHNIDAEAVSRCIHRFCAERLAQPPEPGLPQQVVGPDTVRRLIELLSQPMSGELVSVLSEFMRRAGPRL